LKDWPGWVFILVWGVVVAVLFRVFLRHHDWAQRAFNVEIGDNLLAAGFVVGLSAILLIRTNLATIGSVQVGGEYAYTASRAFLIDPLNRKRVKARKAFLRRHQEACADAGTYPRLFGEAETHLGALAMGSPHQATLQSELANLRQSVQASDPNTDSAARRSVIGLFYDYFGPKEVDDWVNSTRYGNV
jgi:hypothetical protein